VVAKAPTCLIFCSFFYATSKPENNHKLEYNEQALKTRNDTAPLS
jgi:hypothetical protein